MVRKAKLDILDNDINDKVKVSLPENIPLEAAQDSQEKETKTGGAFSDRIKIWAQKPLFWIITVAVPLIVIIAGVTTWIFYEPFVTAPVKKTIENAITPATIKKGNMVLFEGFVIDLMDEKSNTHIVLCDIALELESSRDVGAIEGRSDARNAVYMLLKNSKPQELLVSEGRNRLKEDFKNELNRFFGENLVKNVYFSRIEAM